MKSRIQPVNRPNPQDPEAEILNLNILLPQKHKIYVIHRIYYLTILPYYWGVVQSLNRSKARLPLQKQNKLIITL
jgi:hypothetical protein